MIAGRKTYSNQDYFLSAGYTGIIFSVCTVKPRYFIRKPIRAHIECRGLWLYDLATFKCTLLLYTYVHFQALREMYFKINIRECFVAWANLYIFNSIIHVNSMRRMKRATTYKIMIMVAKYGTEKGIGSYTLIYAVYLRQAAWMKN